MIRLLLIIFVFILSIIGAAYYLNESQPTPLRPATDILPTPTPTPTNILLDSLQKIEFDKYEIAYAVHRVENPETLTLLSNTATQTSSTGLYKDNTCRFLVNGGFYDTKDKHLGWLVSESKQVSPAINSRLFDSYVRYTTENSVQLGFTKPERVVWGLQTGPMLIFESQPLLLKISEDKPARRMVALVDQKGTLYFIAVCGGRSVSTGPLLEKLPEIVKAIADKEGITVLSATNLDGGAASAYIDHNITIREYSYIGSFFCEK